MPETYLLSLPIFYVDRIIVVTRFYITRSICIRLHDLSVFIFHSIHAGYFSPIVSVLSHIFRINSKLLFPLYINIEAFNWLSD